MKWPTRFHCPWRPLWPQPGTRYTERSRRPRCAPRLRTAGVERLGTAMARSSQTEKISRWKNKRIWFTTAHPLLALRFAKENPMKADEPKTNIKIDNQDAYGHAPTMCQNSELACDDGDNRQSSLPRLMTVSEIERDCDPASPLGRVVSWIRGFLARPHPQLGRPGLVCPFVPAALKLDTIRLAEMPDTTASFERLSAIITEYRNVFLETEPVSGPEAMNKVFLV